MLPMRRARLLRPAARRVLLSTSATDTENFQFESLALHDGQSLPAPTGTQRVLENLQIDEKSVQRVLSTKGLRPLPYNTLLAPQQVEKLTPLVRWGFQQLKDDSPAADAVFSALEPHANMAKGADWRLYFQRQFFLSGAPLQTYLRAYKSHLDVVHSSREEATEKDDLEKQMDEVIQEHSPMSKQTTNGRSKGKALAVLTENKRWEWVPFSVASTIVKEFCFRGRFAEAIEAYASLPLTDKARQEVVATLQDHEQYPSVLYLHEVHRAMGSAVSPLDVVPELDALKKLGHVEELDARFQELPAKEQARGEVQALMDN